MTGRVAARDGIYTDILRPQLRVFFSFSDGGLPNRTTLPAVLKKAPKPYRSKLVGKVMPFQLPRRALLHRGSQQASQSATGARHQLTAPCRH